MELGYLPKVLGQHSSHSCFGDIYFYSECLDGFGCLNLVSVVKVVFSLEKASSALGAIFQESSERVLMELNKVAYVKIKCK